MKNIYKHFRFQFAALTLAVGLLIAAIIYSVIPPQVRTYQNEVVVVRMVGNVATVAVLLEFQVATGNEQLMDFLDRQKCMAVVAIRDNVIIGARPKPLGFVWKGAGS
jgi:hypothetical protein